MNWIQRYIQAARPYFPASQRDDLCDELLAQMNDQWDEVETDPNSPTRDAQAKALVQSFGHPMRYASGFHTQQALISQPLFEVYKLVLRNICWVLLGVFSGYALLHGLSHSEVHPVGMALFIITNTVEHFVWFFTAITAVFYFAENQLRKMLDFDSWRADQLPPLRPEWNTCSRGESAFNLVMNVVLAGMVFGWFPALETLALEYPSARTMQLMAVLTPIIGSLLILFAGLHLYHCLRPHWDANSLVANLLLNAAVIGVISILLTIPEGSLPMLVSAKPSTDVILNIFNRALNHTFIVIGLWSAYEIWRDSRRWWQLRQLTQGG